MFEAIRAHRVQRQRELELGMHLPVVPTDENLKQMAEQYVGMSREDARRMQDQIYVQASIITGLEKRIEELAEVQALQASRSSVSEPTEGDRLKTEVAQGGPTPATKPGAFKYERKWTTGKDSKEWMLKKPFNSSDYLADIYDDCVAQNRGVAATATTKVRQSATSELKTFDGRTRDDYRCKAWLSDVRAAFRRDQLPPGDACLQFPDLL
ncbi:hypothetical protein PINS_up014679 [Pythium insidiosum]|nr:hypothetical protein PINS_up014679 [Pythium insidiosum]